MPPAGGRAIGVSTIGWNLEGAPGVAGRRPGWEHRTETTLVVRSSVAAGIRIG